MHIYIYIYIYRARLALQDGEGGERVRGHTSAWLSRPSLLLLQCLHIIATIMLQLTIIVAITNTIAVTILTN